MGCIESEQRSFVGAFVKTACYIICDGNDDDRARDSTTLGAWVSWSPPKISLSSPSATKF